MLQTRTGRISAEIPLATAAQIASARGGTSSGSVTPSQTLSQPASSGGILGLADSVSKAKDVYTLATNPSSFGASTGPLSTALNQFGATNLGLSASGYTLGGSAITSGEAALLTKAGATQGLSAAPTLSGALGAAGIGAFTGSYIAKFTGGNTTGGSIGGGIGAGVGYAFGGPVGGVIGNIAGSLLGSAFGGKGVAHPAAYLGNATLTKTGDITGGGIQSKHIGGDIPTTIGQDFSAYLKGQGVDFKKEQGLGFAYDPGLFGKDTPARITVGRDAEKYNAVLNETTQRVAKEQENQNMLKALQDVPVMRNSINTYLSANNNSFDYNNYFNGLQDGYTKSLAAGISARTGRNEGVVEREAYKAADKAAPQTSFTFNPNDQASVQKAYSQAYDLLAERGVLSKKTVSSNSNATPANQVIIPQTSQQQATQTSSVASTDTESPFQKFLREYRSKQSANLT